MAAEVGGRITAMRVDEGAPVSAGDVVLEIDRERRELELANERAMRGGSALRDRAGAPRAGAHPEPARERGGVAGAARRGEHAAARRAGEARGRRGAARARRSSRVRDASVAAPFDGLVARRFVSAGDHVAEGEQLFDLVALDPIEVEFHLTERDSARVAVGHHVEVRVDAVSRTRSSAPACTSCRRGSTRPRARCA